MIEPSLCHITYLMRDDEDAGTPAREHSVYIPIKGESVYNDQPHFSLDIAYEPHHVTVDIFPKEPLTVTECRLMFSGNFADYRKVLFNGYQSWTDTAEITLDTVTRGLLGTPRQLIDKFVLDGSGDYRFQRYVGKPGAHHGWTFAYFIGAPGVWMVASINETAGFTLLEWSLGEGLNVRREPPEHELVAGTFTRLADIAIIEKRAPAHANQPVVEDAEQLRGPQKRTPSISDALAHALVDEAFEDWFDMMRQAQTNLALPRENRLLTGYTSWYRHYDKIDDGAIRADLAAAERAFAGLDTTGFSRVFQIDDGYARVGDWLDVDRAKFPDGMAPLARDIAAAGFVPGIWLAPFVCETASKTYAEHPEWLLRDASGNAVKAGSHWTGSYALDTLNPQVRDYVTTCLRTMVDEWGFSLFKLDFLYAACMLPHGGKNRGELMVDAMRLVREALGDAAIIDGCGVPLASAFGIVDFCRIGCDVGLDWDGALYMRMTERERVSTRNSLFNTIYRSPLDGRAFGNDPDVLLLRKDVSYSDEQRTMLIYGDACHASMLLTSDDFNEWTMNNLNVFQKALSLMRTAHDGEPEGAK